MSRTGEESEAAEAPPPGPKRPANRKSGGGIQATIGGILVGFDQEIMRRLPPTQELVKRGAPVRRVTGEDGSDLVIGLPEDLAEDEPVEAGPPAAPSHPEP